jgi:hypothetical protein
MSRKKSKSESANSSGCFLIFLFLIFIAVFTIYSENNMNVNYRKYGSCLNCQMHWHQVSPHKTDISKYNIKELHDYFPLCEKCWKKLGTAEKRLPFYRRLFDECNEKEVRYDENDWISIKDAVLKEK